MPINKFNYDYLSETSKDVVNSLGDFRVFNVRELMDHEGMTKKSVDIYVSVNHAYVYLSFYFN